MPALSPNFTTEMFEKSDTAKRLGLNNQIPQKLMPYATWVALQMEVVMRILGGNKISVSSMFRGPQLNNAVKGSKTSAHRWALAVDFKCPQFGNTRQICQAIVAAGMQFDQLILEFPEASTGGWVHIGFAVPNMRNQKLIASKVGGKTKYTKVDNY